MLNQQDGGGPILIKEEIKEVDCDTDSTDADLSYMNNEMGGFPSVMGDDQDSSDLMVMKVEQPGTPGSQQSGGGLQTIPFTEGLNTTLPGPSDIQSVSDLSCHAFCRSIRRRIIVILQIRLIKFTAVILSKPP